MAGVGHLKRIWKGEFRVAGAIQETCSSEMLGGIRRSGRRFPERGCILEHEIFRFVKMIFCVTGATLRMTRLHFFVAGAALKTDGMEKSQTALVRGRQLCTQL